MRAGGRGSVFRGWFAMARANCSSHSELSFTATQVPDWAHEKLERRASKAILFLQQLTSAQQLGEGGTKNPTMPKSAVVSSQVCAYLVVICADLR